MRVLYFTYGYSPHDHRFLTAINACGHEVHYMNIDPFQNLEQRSLTKDINLVAWWGNQKKRKIFCFPRMVTEFRKELSRIKPDVIHTGPVQSVAPIAVRSGYQPIVTMSWGSDLLREADRTWINNRITRYVLKNSKVLVGDCQAVIEKANCFGFPRAHTVIFPWGVDLGHFSVGNNVRLRRELGWEKEFVILSNRSWEPIYGVENVISAFYHARKKYPDFKMLLLGSGPLKKRIIKQINKLELIDHICIGGRVNYEDLPDYYCASDIYVSASKSDGSSVSLLESMASGTPVLVSDIPGNREWVKHGENGFLFDPERIHHLTDLFIHARESKAELKRMAEESKKIVFKYADWNKNYKKLNIAYQMALELNHPERMNNE